MRIFLLSYIAMIFSLNSHIPAMIISHDAHIFSSYIESIVLDEGYFCTLRGEYIVMLERLKFSNY